MPIIGYNTIGAAGSMTSGIFARGTPGAAYLYTAQAGDAITQFHAYCFTLGGVREFVRVAVYAMAGTVPLDRLHTEKNISSAGAAPSWKSSAAVNISLVPGQTYCVCWRSSTATTVYYDNFTNQADNNDIGTLSDPWDHRNFHNAVGSVYCDITNTPPGDPAVRFPCCAQLIVLP